MARDSRIGIVVGLLMILACGLLVNEIINPGQPLEPALAQEPGDSIVATPPSHTRPVRLVVSHTPQRTEPRQTPAPQTNANPYRGGLVAMEPAGNAPTPTNTTPEPQGVVTPQPEVRRYHVVGGDTLTAVAVKVYGPGQEDEYWRIFQANRNQLNDPGDIYPGQMLVIPPLTDAADPAELQAINRPQAQAPLAPRGVLETDDGQPMRGEMDAQELRAHLQARQPQPAPRVAPEPVVAPAPQQVAYRSYVVRSGDTLTAIARRELGDDSTRTVNAIYELNRNVLRDPNQLSIGTTIRIPERP